MSARALIRWALWPFKHQKNAVDSVPQRFCAVDGRSQMAGTNNLIANAAAAKGDNGASNNFDNYCASLNSVGRSNIEVQNWGAGVANDFQRLCDGRLGFVGHSNPPVSIGVIGAYGQSGSKWSRK